MFRYVGCASLWFHSTDLRLIAEQVGKAHQRQGKKARSETFTPSPAVEVLKRLPDGSVAPLNHVLLNVGDFVDVLMSFDVVDLGDRKPVHLRLESIVQLKEADEVQRVSELMALCLAKV